MGAVLVLNKQSIKACVTMHDTQSFISMEILTQIKNIPHVLRQPNFEDFLTAVTEKVRIAFTLVPGFQLHCRRGPYKTKPGDPIYLMNMESSLRRARP